MVDFMVWMIAVCVAPLVLALVVLKMKGSGGAIPDELVAKLRLTPVHRVPRVRRASAHTRGPITEGLTRRYGPACSCTGPWEDGSRLSDVVSDEIWWLSRSCQKQRIVSSVPRNEPRQPQAGDP